jgi:hypothetical protein
MAVLQISKIQVRRGQELVTGVPQLSAGEFAWSADVQKLYIGNGSTAAPPSGDGAPSVGNTEILTANSISNGNLFTLESYQYAKNNPVIRTGTANFPIIRTLQAKLDDYVTTRDFGSKGDPSLYTSTEPDDTKALQRAITQLYANTDAATVINRKPLRIPAGTYLITGTLYIPPYATIVGDGIDKTIIKQLSTGSAIMQFCGLSAQGNLTYQNDFTIQGGIRQPQSISVSGMTIGYNSSLAEQGQQGLIEADCVKDGVISNIKFQGVNTTPINDSVVGVEIRGLGATTTKNLKIEHCIFENLSSGVASNYDSNDIYIRNNEFRSMTVAVNFAYNLTSQAAPYSTPTSIGPQHVLIQGNRFENVYAQAIFVGTNTNNVPTFINSANNEYLNCGNKLTTEASQSYEVLGYYTPGNTSENDYFFRFDENNTLTNAATVIYPTVMGPASIAGRTASALTLVPDVGTYQHVLTVAKTKTDQLVKLSYVATQSSTGVTRRGDLSVVANSSLPIVTDSYSYSGPTDGGILFTATVSTVSNALSISALIPTTTTFLEFEYNQLY